jgi:hypothetical protein
MPHVIAPYPCNLLEQHEYREAMIYTELLYYQWPGPHLASESFKEPMLETSHVRETQKEASMEVVALWSLLKRLLPPTTKAIYLSIVL